MIYRKDPLVNGEVYHVFNKSIAGFKIFNNDPDYERMIREVSFYQIKDRPHSFSYGFKEEERDSLVSNVQNVSEKIVDVVAYCLMPTHIHFILKQLQDRGISRFMSFIQNSYTRYFNTRYKRKGPLWESRFKNVLVKTDDQFIHLTRYVHLNPVSSFLVNEPEAWKYSSYGEYLGITREEERICNFSDYVNMNAQMYKDFVTDRIDYQRELTKIKKLMLE